MILVQKFGGTSIGSVKSLARVLKFIERSIQLGFKPVVVVSAMSGVTDSLISTFKSVSKGSLCPEYDSILSTGEQISSAIIAASLKARGIKARSFLGWQIPIITDNNNSCAKIEHIHTNTINQSISSGEIPIISGFQGISYENRITTLGRGGSDTTAVAISAALGSSVCNIYTDVSGIFSADPNKVSNPLRIDTLSYRQALLMSHAGAKVLHPRAIEIGMNHNVKINVLSSFDDNSPMTTIQKTTKMEKNSVLGINSLRGVVLIKIQDLEPYTHKINDISQILKDVSVNALHIYFDAKGKKSSSILLNTEVYRPIAQNITEFCQKNSLMFVVNENISSVTLTCANSASCTFFLSEALKSLNIANIEVMDILSSDLNISFIINKQDEVKSVNVLHETFFYKTDMSSMI